MIDVSTDRVSGKTEPDDEVIRKLGEAFLSQVAARVIMETQDLDQALTALRHQCGKYLDESGLGESAAAVHLSKSGKSVKRYEQPAEPKPGGGRGYALMRTVIRYFVEHQEGATPGQCLGAIADDFPKLSRQDLLELLDFYCHLGYLVRDGERFKPARPTLRTTPEELEGRLTFASDALRHIWPALRGYVIDEPGSEVKRLHLFATEAEFDEFMEALGQFIQQWIERGGAATTGDGLDPQRRAFALLIMTSGLKVRGESEFKQLINEVKNQGRAPLETVSST